MSDEDEKNKIKDEWENKTGKTDEEVIKEYEENTSNEEIDKEKAQESEKDDPDKGTIYRLPKRIPGETGENGEVNPEDIVNDADSFVSDPNAKNYINTSNLQDFSQGLYGILLGIAIIIAVIMGAIIGIKLMFAPIGEKAEAKNLLVPYSIGCA